jgi:hypothetical protein
MEVSPCSTKASRLAAVAAMLLAAALAGCATTSGDGEYYAGTEMTANRVGEG